MRAWLAAGALGFMLCASCEQRSAQPHHLKRAQFGVFFGGDVQELQQIPLQPDSARQSIGIRLTFVRPPDPPLKIKWELARPRKSQVKSKEAPVSAIAGDAGKPVDTLVEFGEVTTRPGETTLDIPLALRPGDPLGDWSVRVEIEGQEVLDRPFRLVRPAPSKARPSDD